MLKRRICIRNCISGSKELNKVVKEANGKNGYGLEFSCKIFRRKSNLLQKLSNNMFLFTKSCQDLSESINKFFFIQKKQNAFAISLENNETRKPGGEIGTDEMKELRKLLHCFSTSRLFERVQEPIQSLRKTCHDD